MTQREKRRFIHFQRDDATDERVARLVALAEEKKVEHDAPLPAGKNRGFMASIFRLALAIAEPEIMRRLEADGLTAIIDH